MGSSILTLFFSASAMAYVFLWLFFLALFTSGRRKKSQDIICLASALLIIHTGIGLKIAYNTISVFKSDNVYKITFGSSPPPDVKNIQSYYYYFADLGITYLKFNASPSTIKKLTAKGWNRLKDQKLADVRASNDTSTEQDDDTPKWFRPNITQSTMVYTSEHRIGDFASENETLTYDSATQQAYYSFLGID